MSGRTRPSDRPKFFELSGKPTETSKISICSTEKPTDQVACISTGYFYLKMLL